MHLIVRIIENLVVTILSLALLGLVIYILLLIMHWGLKIKSGRREEEALTELMTQHYSTRRQHRPKDDEHFDS